MLRRATAAAVLLTAAIVSAATPRISGQATQTPPVFRAGVDVVQLDVSVLDENRQPVRGLTAEDFTVYERGVPQSVVSFAAIDLPRRPAGRAAWMHEVAPDVMTNHHDAQRVVLILMDDCQTPFDPRVSTIAKTIGHQTIDHLGPSDLAAVIYTAGRRQGQEFTIDRTHLRAAVDRFTPRGGAPTPSPFSASRTSSGRTPLGVDARACPGVRSVSQAFQNAATVLRGWPGWRKTLVFVSPFAPAFHVDTTDALVDRGVWGAVFDAMQEANLTVYQFDPRGLEVGSTIAEDLDLLADATGGRSITRTNAPEDGVPQMFRENSSYYVLGIQPLDGTRNGRFRPVDVRVNRPGLTVRTRAGYFAPSDEAPARPSNRPERPALERAIAGGLPSGDVPMSLAVAPLAGDRPRTGVIHVVAGFGALGLPADGEEIDVLVTAFRDDWKEAGTVTQSVHVTAPRRGGPPHVDIPLELDVPPGRYEIRAALTRTRAGQTGSAYASVVVPDFSREALVLSGVLIEWKDAATSDGNGGRTSGAAAPRATTRRQFTPTDQIAARMTVYQGGRQPPLVTHIEMRIVDDSDRVRASRRLEIQPPSFAEARGAEVQFDVPLTGLEPGEYLVSFDATSARGASVRHVRLSVR